MYHRNSNKCLPYSTNGIIFLDTFYEKLDFEVYISCVWKVLLNIWVAFAAILNQRQIT